MKNAKIHVQAHVDTMLSVMLSVIHQCAHAKLVTLEIRSQNAMKNHNVRLHKEITLLNHNQIQYISNTTHPYYHLKRFTYLNNPMKLFSGIYTT